MARVLRVLMALALLGLAWTVSAPDEADAASCAAPSLCEFDNATSHIGANAPCRSEAEVAVSPNYAAYACFGHTGDRLIVADNAKDGRSVGIQWHTTDGRRGGICLNSHGRPTTGFDWWACDKNLPEGTSIRYRVGTCDHGKYSCRSGSQFVAADWSGVSQAKVA